MPRIPPIDPDEAAPQTRQKMDQDLATFGQVLPSTGLYGRNPALIEATKALDAGVSAATRVPKQLRMLVNVRVASLVGCPF